MIIASLILLGLCFGSFTNALVWRFYQKNLSPKKRAASLKDLSISNGRSMCVHCKHTLGTLDLVPVLSWLGLRGQCRYCHKPISAQYPLVELTTACLFVFSYIFWPNNLVGLGWVSFGLWLIALVMFMALIIYDIRWMLLPNKVIFPLFVVSAAYALVEVVQNQSLEPLVASAVGVLIGGGIFYVLFQISDGKWIGGGDVKLGFALGALLGGFAQPFLMLFVASLLGSIVSVPFLLKGKRNVRIPFGPFLITATILVQLFGATVIDWYTKQFIYL